MGKDWDMKYPKSRIDIHKRIKDASFERIMMYSDKRFFCAVIAEQIADDVVDIIHNNYRRRVK